MLFEFSNTAEAYSHLFVLEVTMLTLGWVITML